MNSREIPVAIVGCVDSVCNFLRPVRGLANLNQSFPAVDGIDLGDTADR